MTEAPNEPDDRLAMLLDATLQLAADKVVAGAGFHDFCLWFSESFPDLLPELAQQVEGGDVGRRGLALKIARDLWREMPNPTYNWRPAPLPKLERNAPCPCGSGQKYKHCCGTLDAIPSPITGLNLLIYVLQALPRQAIRNLPYKQLSPIALADAAHTWAEKGRVQEAVRLLEPLFEHPEALDERHEPAFDVLADLYNELDKPRKKKALVERMMSAPDVTLRSAAMHRRCCMLADEGDYAAAWALFDKALRLQPDNPGLAQLEITLLLSEGKSDLAQERARFWAQRLTRLQDPDLEELVGWLHEVAQNASRAAFGLVARGDPAFERLADLLEAAPAPTCHYQLEVVDRDAGPLTPKRDLQTLERRWAVAFEGDSAGFPDFDPSDPEVWQRAGTWLDWLAAHPLAWHSFRVLDDLVLALDGVGADIPGVQERLLIPVLDRAVSLLRTVLAAHQAEDARLEWAHLDNRPALRLAARRIHLLEDSAPHEACSLAEWLVFTLNPRDNQGLRARLSRLYLASGRHEDALALAQRYPEDFAAMQYSHALALYRLGRRDEARQVLEQATAAYPRVLKTLLAANPRRPRLDPGYVTLGGSDEAWYYREDHLALWQQDGALEWARTLARKR